MRHEKELRRFIADGDYEMTEGGILIHSAIMARGRYFHNVNGEDEQADWNLLPTEGIHYLLDAGLGADTQLTAWYLALYSGNVSPVATWTAANFTANATENTSTSEGYSGANRPTWTPGAASGGKIGNLSSRAAYTIVTASTVTFYGAGLLSAQTRGAVTGKLVSATKFATARTLNNGDTFNLGYEVELTDS